MEKKSKKNDTDAIILEAVRKAELDRKDWDLSNEFDAAIYSMWHMIDPLELNKRDSIGTTDRCDTVVDEKKVKTLRFTAHSHAGHPHEESPDDLRIYALLNKLSKRYIHFIMDKFLILRKK